MRPARAQKTKQEEVEAMKRKEVYERSQALKRIQQETEKAKQLIDQRSQLQASKPSLLVAVHLHSASYAAEVAPKRVMPFYHLCTHCAGQFALPRERYNTKLTGCSWCSGCPGRAPPG